MEILELLWMVKNSLTKYFFQAAQNHGASQNEGQKDFVIFCGQKSISSKEKNANISGSGLISWCWI